MTSVFVSGTDTDVGKTRISVALVELFQQQGLQVAVMKPIASGCEMANVGLRNDDALKLIEQSNLDLDYQVVNPYSFSPAIAPHIAAAQVKENIDLAVIKQRFNQLQQQSDSVVVEGAGGWLVPINDTETMADLAKLLALPVILVVGIKLGCINHALLTVAAIKKSGLVLQGWVANQCENNDQAEEIISTLKQMISAPCLGVVPFLAEQQSAAEFLDFNPNK
ncbi:MAG: dethiobiotin synthase [Gammaproteobacteria bacterium]|nr:MAG: dethiobiotin synthase [Gammaproteobacteria bacterium]